MLLHEPRHCTFQFPLLWGHATNTKENKELKHCTIDLWHVTEMFDGNSSPNPPQTSTFPTSRTARTENLEVHLN